MRAFLGYPKHLVVANLPNVDLIVNVFNVLAVEFADPHNPTGHGYRPVLSQFFVLLDAIFGLLCKCVITKNSQPCDCHSFFDANSQAVSFGASSCISETVSLQYKRQNQQEYWNCHKKKEFQL